MFQAMLRQSVIEDLMATEGGRDYLAKCERMKITEMDENIGEFREVINNGIKS